VVNTGASQTVPVVESTVVRAGDLVSMKVGPRGGDHSCDLTRINLVITELTGAKRIWNLEREVADTINEGNPHPDRHGHSDTWHFYQEPVAGGSRVVLVPDGSLLARWQAADGAKERAALAGEISQLVGGPRPKPNDSPDAKLYDSLTRLDGTLLGLLDPATLTKPDIPRPKDGLPQDVDEHMRLMCDILVLGFQTDTTRVATLKLNNDHSSMRFPHLGVDYMIHHLLSHNDTADWLKVNQFFIEQLAYIAGKLEKIEEGGRSALDNSVLLYCSSMLTGHHDATQLPVLVLGGGGGTIQGGRVLDYRGQANRKMCSLYLSLLETVGIHRGEFGDSTERLSEV